MFAINAYSSGIKVARAVSVSDIYQLKQALPFSHVLVEIVDIGVTI